MEFLDKKRAFWKWLLIIFVFGIYFFIADYKLTNASLWLDETIEYWYSKFFTGAVPGGRDMNSMYERIVSTYQPPLYNVVMHFWLLVSSSERWFRFFGVLMGFVGAVGLYKVVEKEINYKAAAVSVILYSFIYRLMYYIQECAEYNLMLANLFWLIWFYICVLERPSRKNITFFTIFCILSVYSQYGAIFPVGVMVASVFVNIVKRKNKRELKYLLFSYSSAFICAVIPLYVFFLQKQMKRQQVFGGNSHRNDIQKNIFYDCMKSLYQVFKWNFAGSNNSVGKWIALLFLVIFLLLCLFFLIYGKKQVKNIIIINSIIWIVYYTAVKLEVYAYGDIANRYNLFFIPLWIHMIVVVVHASWQIFIDSCRNCNNKKSVIYNRLVAKFFLFLCMFFFCSYNWEMLRQNWNKENIRDVVRVWYEKEGYNSDTLIYYSADSGFYYYVTETGDYNTNLIDFSHIVTQESMIGKTKKEYIKYLNGIYGKKWPSELYLAASHYRDDLDIMLQCFKEKGYQQEILYDNDAKLIMFTK